ncbi:MAG TPA: type II toxin-antitoxin system Phd/YefM family antitoxin [Tepidisphaeraceae bacterium]|nr:type II toxin-antitoxin system Phd/YefM family antitoxin [Tepidisphaeraceae bacterium]
MPTVSATQLHDRTASLVDRAMARPDDPVVVEKRGKRAVVLVDADYFDGLIETLDLLSDKDASAALQRGLADLAAGRVTGHGDVMRELGLDEQAERYDRLVGRGKGGAAADRKPHRAGKDRPQGRRGRRVA